PVGGIIGLARGVVGVGGGIFLSPVILLKKWATPKTAAATSALFIWLNSAAGMTGAAVSGQLVLEADVLIPFIGAVLIGGSIGSRYGAKVASQNNVRTILVAVLIIAAIRRIIAIIGF
nr:TSUP family transporter [Nitrospinota bacterium]